MKVFKNAWFSRFARKEKIPASALWDAQLKSFVANGQFEEVPQDD